MSQTSLPEKKEIHHCPAWPSNPESKAQVEKIVPAQKKDSDFLGVISLCYQ